ncbi:MAG: aminodeoxychorismate lyase [Saprospiraceae bacterium]|nr:MAG: aminodeoxychorismate lyase [Saprospiraceae bacterium]
MKKSILYSILGLLAIIGIGSLLIYQQYIASAAVPRDIKDPIILIPTNSSFEEVTTILKNKGVVPNEKVFRFMAEKMNYKKNPMRAGRYEVQPGWSTVSLIRHLRGGKQAPVKVILTNERLLEDLAAKVARFTEPDSIDFINLFQDESYLQEINYTPETLMSLFIPNTYEFFWNSKPKEFVERMIKEHDAFWEKENRLAKAEKLGLSPAEVYTLASIVEKETLANEEKERMAGVYYNRIQQGIRLQADPTSVFATRDFDTPRVTNYHTKFDSPYNTYRYAGLPPGPITMTSISSIDAVLNLEAHDYIFFCARGDGSGLHNFAKTLAGHNQNAKTYKANLRKRGLR